MSDRVTNVEIEDVLSSIRRLVSEAATGPVARPSVPEAPLSAGPGVGKLLLTEAHRIIPPPEVVDSTDVRGVLAGPQPDPGAEPGMPPDDIHATSLLSDTGIVLDLPFAFRSRTQIPVEADYSTHISCDDGTPKHDVVPMAEIPTAGQASATDVAPDNLPHGIDWRNINPGQRLADTIVGLEVATNNATGDWEPDGSEDVPVMDWAAATEQVEEGPVPIFRSRKPPPLRLTLADVVRPDAGAVQSAAVLPFHADRARPPEDMDHDGLSHDLLRLDFQDRESAHDASDAAIMEALRDANGVSEAVLREIVLDIVRQELQGALGERITRNVRKLVRREINRVLNEAEQD